MVYSTDQFLLSLGGQLRPHVFLPTIGKSEVNKFEIKMTALQKHKILRLQIAMSNMMRMTVAERLHNLNKDPPRILLRKITI